MIMSLEFSSSLFSGLQRAWASLHFGCCGNFNLLEVMEINCLHLNSRSITFFFSLVYFAEKGLDNDRRAEDGEGRKALDLVNISPI